MECHKVPRLPTQNDMITSFLTRRKRHVVATFPIGTATSASRQSCTSHTHTRGMSQSATPATQNDMTTSSDTSKKTRFCNFSHRHGNFHTSQRQNQRFPTSFLMLTAKSTFRARLPSIFMTCHKMPGLPRNWHTCHHFAQP